MAESNTEIPKMKTNSKENELSLDIYIKKKRRKEDIHPTQVDFLCNFSF